MKFLNKIIEYGLYLLVFLLPLQTRWIIKAGELNGGPWEYGTYSLYGTDILLILLLLLFFVKAVYSWIAGQARNDKTPLIPLYKGDKLIFFAMTRLRGGLFMD